MKKNVFYFMGVKYTAYKKIKKQHKRIHKKMQENSYIALSENKL